MEEIFQRRDEINQKLEYLARAKNNANHRKLKSTLKKELNSLDEKAKKILSKKLENEELTLEKFEVSNVFKYTAKNGHVLYPTSYATIENEPAAFIGCESTLKTYGIFPQEMTEQEIRNQLCREQENNDKIIEEEEEYESVVIPRTPKKKHKSSK